MNRLYNVYIYDIYFICICKICKYIHTYVYMCVCVRVLVLMCLCCSLLTWAKLLNDQPLSISLLAVVTEIASVRENNIIDIFNNEFCEFG